MKPLDNKGARFEFPSLPSEIKVKNGANQLSYKIISLGAVKIPRGTNCEEISWDGYFFGPSKRGEAMIQAYMEPKSCVSILEAMRDAGKPVTLMATEVGINRDVTISDFQWKPYGGHGNIQYSIVFTQWKDLQVKTVKTVQTHFTPNSAADTPKERPEPEPAATYTITSGDSLWKIAQKQLGSGSDWQKIYDANKDVIEAAAKKHGKSSSDKGHWIYPGVTLTIPA